MVIPLFLVRAKKQEIIASGSFCWLVLTIVLHQPRLAPRRMKKKIVQEEVRLLMQEVFKGGK